MCLKGKVTCYIVEKIELCAISEPFQKYFSVLEIFCTVSEIKWCIMGRFEPVGFLINSLAISCNLHNICR